MGGAPGRIGCAAARAPLASPLAEPEAGVAVVGLSLEEKRRFLKALEEDEEFRLAVAGLVGLREILEELRELRRKSLEHDKRFEAIERKLLEHDKRFEAIERKLLEHDRRLEAIEKKLLEHDKRFEAIERKLLEHDEKFRAVIEEIKSIKEEIRSIKEEIKSIKEEIRKIWEAIYELNKRVNRLEDVVGALTESTYAKFFLDTVLYELAASGRRLEKWERNATVDGEEIDLLIVTEEKVYVVEVKVKPRHADVGSLLAKAELVARRYPGREVVPVLTGARIGREVEGYARGKGVMVVQW